MEFHTDHRAIGRSIGVDPDRATALVAGRQHGLVTRAQALEAGLSKRAIETRLQTGRWELVDKGLYRLAGYPGGWHARLLAPVLVRRDAIVSGRPAATLHRFEGYRSTRPEITVPPSASARTGLATVRRRQIVERTVVDGIPCTTVPQTIVDLAALADRDRLIKATDLLLSDRRLRLEDLEQTVLAATGLRPPGIRFLHELVARYQSGERIPASALERELHDILIEIGATGWRAQQPAPWAPDGSEIVDVLFDMPLLVLEADGRTWHTRVADFENDRRRDNLAAACGYRVLRFTAAALRANRDDTMAMLRRILEAA